MHLINTSNWRTLTLSGQTTFCSGTFLPTLPANRREHYQPFACVALDSQTGVLSAWRDHFGQEPFYYSYQNGRFVFGSTIPDIIKHLPKHPLPNYQIILADIGPWHGTNWPTYSNETYYEGIFRVEPGHTLTIKNNQIKSAPFWEIDPLAPRIHYKNDEDYVEHFSELLQEAVKNCIGDKSSVAAELSGGLDSSAVVLACNQVGLSPALYSHVAPANSEEQDDLPHAHCLIEHLKLSRLREITAEKFDLENVLNKQANLYAGAAPYVFFMLANNVHQAVASGKHSVLLSGYGGDECVSGHAIGQAFYPQLLRMCLFKEAWKQIRHQSQSTMSKSFIHLFRHAHPAIYYAASRLSQLKSSEPPRQMFPYYKSLQHLEWDLLQGPRSHQVRMRVEYSAVAAKALGFSYAYPLLYPKLVEFYCRLPWDQKRRNGVDRYLIRQYLARHVPEMVSAKSKKGGGIMPATLHLAKQMYREGKLDRLFQDLPFAGVLSKIDDPKTQLLAKMDAYMFKHYWNSVGI